MKTVMALPTTGHPSKITKRHQETGQRGYLLPPSNIISTYLLIFWRNCYGTPEIHKNKLVEFVNTCAHCAWKQNILLFHTWKAWNLYFSVVSKVRIFTLRLFSNTDRLKWKPERVTLWDNEYSHMYMESVQCNYHHNCIPYKSEQM